MEGFAEHWLLGENLGSEDVAEQKNFQNLAQFSEICVIIEGFADEGRFAPQAVSETSRKQKNFGSAPKSVLQCKASLIAAGQAR